MISPDETYIHTWWRPWDEDVPWTFNGFLKRYYMLGGHHELSADYEMVLIDEVGLAQALDKVSEIRVQGLRFSI